MEKTSNFRLFFKRLLFIIAAAVIVILVLYGCSTSRAVSQYKTYLIANDIGTKYQSRDAVYVLEIVSENEAYFYVNDSVEAYQTEVKDNLLLLTYKDEKNVFIALSRNEMFYQTKNKYLYRVVIDE